MPSSRNDKEFLADMLAAAEEIREFTKDIDASSSTKTSYDGAPWSVL
jgi:uncharacterized protein with HEPN domain